MHEYSITTSIIDILEGIGKKNSLKRIKKVNFELDPLSNIEPESIRFYYEYLTRDNEMLRGAELVFTEISIEMACMSCSHAFNRKEFEPLCPKCGSTDVKISGSDDIKIMSVEA
jgi:hydrogenase nickel incorporation protein HypA/HybF